MSSTCEVPLLPFAFKGILSAAKAGVLSDLYGTPEQAAETLGWMHGSGRAGLQARVQVLYFCHPERSLVREGSVVLSFSAASEGVPLQDAYEACA
jgi:hypothetical protein